MTTQQLSIAITFAKFQMQACRISEHDPRWDDKLAETAESLTTLANIVTEDERESAIKAIIDGVTTAPQSRFAPAEYKTPEIVQQLAA